MIELTDDGARLDVARVHGRLAGSSWSAGIARDTVERAPAGIRRVALVTLDAHGVYAPLGLHAPLCPRNAMERLSAEAAAMLRAAS